MPNAARAIDHHSCPMQSPATHTGGPILKGSPDVYINGLPAARVGDTCHCQAPAPDAVLGGSGTVFINGLPSVRKGDPTVHCGTIVGGSPDVDIGG